MFTVTLSLSLCSLSLSHTECDKMVAADNRPEQLGKGETGRAMRFMTGRFTKNMVSSTERVLSLSKQQAGRAAGSAYSLCAAPPQKNNLALHALPATTTNRVMLPSQRQTDFGMQKRHASFYKTISTILLRILCLGVRKGGRAR